MDLKDQLKQIKPRGGKVRIRQKYPRRVQRIYQAEMQKLIVGITRHLNDSIKPMIKKELRQDSKADVIRAIAEIADLSLSPEALARRIALAVRDSNDNTIRQAVERAIGVNILTPGSALAESIELWVVENASLITNLRDDHVKRIQGTVTRGFQRGLTSGEIAKQISADTGIAMRRAKTIARDQVGTLNAQITEQRDRELGIEKYIWRNVGDIRVRGNPSGLYPNARPSHWDREGNEYSWDNPPRGGHPGEPINCRCYAEAIIDF